MVSKTFWLLALLVSLFGCDLLSNVAAGRTGSRRRRSERNSTRVSERKCEEYTRGTTCINSYDYIDPTAVEDAELGEFPHLAFISGSYYKETRLLCTGSLISPRFVLTVAHCGGLQYQPSYVTLGDHNKNEAIDDGVTPLQVPIKAIHKHPKYKRPRKYNDIALLELGFDVPFNANIRPACLGTNHQLFKNDKGLIATIDHSGHTDVIQKVSTTIKDSDACSFMISRDVPAIKTSQLCAQEATGSLPDCKANSGSPLQIVLNTQNGCEFHVIGVTSYGSRICNEYPTLFTRISEYVDWIESVVWPEEN